MFFITCDVWSLPSTLCLEKSPITHIWESYVLQSGNYASKYSWKLQNVVDNFPLTNDETILTNQHTVPSVYGFAKHGFRMLTPAFPEIFVEFTKYEDYIFFRLEKQLIIFDNFHYINMKSQLTMRIDKSDESLTNYNMIFLKIKNASINLGEYELELNSNYDFKNDWTIPTGYILLMTLDKQLNIAYKPSYVNYNKYVEIYQMKNLYPEDLMVINSDDTISFKSSLILFDKITFNRQKIDYISFNPEYVKIPIKIDGYTYSNYYLNFYIDVTNFHDDRVYTDKDILIATGHQNINDSKYLFQARHKYIFIGTLVNNNSFYPLKPNNSITSTNFSEKLDAEIFNSQKALYYVRTDILSSNIQPYFNFDGDNLNLQLGVITLMPNYMYLNCGFNIIDISEIVMKRYWCLMLKIEKHVSQSNNDYFNKEDSTAKFVLVNLNASGYDKFDDVKSSEYIPLLGFFEKNPIYQHPIFVSKNFDNLQNSIKELNSKISNIQTLQPMLPNNYLYHEIFKNSDLSEWTNNSLFTKTFDGVTLKTGNDLTLKRMYQLNRKLFRLRFINNGDCTFNFGLRYVEQGTDRNSYFSINTANNIISYGSNSKSFVFNSGREYILEFEMHYFEYKIRIKDYLTGKQSDELTGKFNVFLDSCSMQLMSGTSPTIKDLTIICPVINPFVMIVGDSITQGGDANQTSTGVYLDSYAELIGKATNKPYVVGGRGSGNINGIVGTANYKGQLETVVSILKPTYLLVMIGTNGGNTATNLQQLVDRCKEIGVKLILNNIPTRALGNGVDDSPVSEKFDTKNKLITEIREKNNLNGIMMNIATSVNNDGETLDTNLFAKYTDYSGPKQSLWIHPNVEGHKMMAERAKIDCPELFE